MVKELLERWPLVRQLRAGADGTGVESMSERTRNLLPKNQHADFTRAMCPYCGVGCGQMIYHKGGELISIEGDPGSPISRGRLCPKGADTYELHTHSNRLMTVKHRRPFATEWEDMDLEVAMDRVADLLWESRERTFVEKQDGETVMQTKAIAHLGGATLDNEENYLIKKLFSAGLGMVCISNQARI
jgi:formate dehydrogenase major subunit